MAYVKFGAKKYKIPGSRPVRVVLGVLLVIGGILGFLPILGFWMIPLGLLILSVDFHWVRRLRRRVEIWWTRRRREKAQNRKSSAE